MRRPCKICRPVRLTAEEEYARIAPYASEEVRAAQQKRIEKKQAEAKRNELVDVRLLGGQRVEVARKLLVGYCHNRIHPGKLTRKLMEGHDCIGKKCRFFEKYEDAEYWRECAQKAAEKQQLKKEKRTKKEHEAAVQSHKELFQSYADEIGYCMKIVRVQEEKTNVFKVFYVSEHPFRDGNLFPNFLSVIQSEHPQYRILMRHIQDMQGHFVTTEEYEQIRR